MLHSYVIHKHFSVAQFESANIISYYGAYFIPALLQKYTLKLTYFELIRTKDKTFSRYSKSTSQFL